MKNLIYYLKGLIYYIVVAALIWSLILVVGTCKSWIILIGLPLSIILIGKYEDEWEEWWFNEYEKEKRRLSGSLYYR